MGASIIVVEDDHDIADMVVRALTRAGHDLTYVHTGTAAIAAVTRTAPDLVLLDLGLPDIDGLDVCRHIRANGYTGGVIVATARTPLDDAPAALDAGANDFLPKPFGLAELSARVNEVLRNADTRPAALVTTTSGLTLHTPHVPHARKLDHLEPGTRTTVRPATWRPDVSSSTSTPAPPPQ